MVIGLFGGSFDPPHVGHQMAVLYALATARPTIDRLLVVPCFQHPFDKRLTPYPHRLAMAELAVRPFSARVAVSDIERRLGGESRTLRTVKAILDENPGAKLALVIGSDLLAERERWFGYAELERLVEFVIVGRAGYGPPSLAVPDVSSTEIRNRRAAGQSLDGWVPSSVVDYLTEHGLYR